MDLLPRALVRLACVACLIFTAVPADAADRVPVTGDVEEGLGRLEFAWPRPVVYDARVILGRLVLRFAEPADFDFSGLQDAMPQYLGAPRVVSEGKVIAFPLRIPVALSHRQDGTRIVVELHDEQGLAELSTAADTAAPAEADVAAAEPAEPATADPAAEPVVADPAADDSVADKPVADEPAAASGEALALETAAGSAGAASLPLRVGEHAGFSRLVFDWPREIAYRIEQRGGRVTIDFAAAAELDLSQFRRYGLSNVSDIKSETGPDGLKVTLTLPGQRLVRHFLNGSYVVVDVVDDAAAAKLADSLAVMELVPHADDDAAAAAEPAPDPAPVSPVAAEPITGSEPRAPTTDGEDGAPQVADSDTQSSVQTSEPEAAPEPEPAEPLPTSLATPQVAPLASVEPGEPGEPGELTLAEPREADHGGLAPAPGEQISARSPVELRFDWPSDPGRAAVFRRGRHLWIVFDQPLAEGASAHIAKNVPDLAPVERLTAENAPAAAVLRLNLPWAFVPELRRGEGAWIVDLQPRADEPRTTLVLDYLDETADARIRFPAGDAGGVIRVTDPDLGDRLEIVPLPTPGLGLKQQQRFLQFRALATYQGLAIIPLSDGLVVEAAEDGVTLRDAGGLLVSPAADRDRTKRDNLDFESGLRLFDLETWRRAEQGTPAEVRQALLAAVVAAPPSGVDPARLELARFHFAHGLATESLAVLRLISQENQRLAIDPQVLLLRASSEFLAGNLERAAEMLNDPVLTGEWEALLWQGAIAAVSRDWPFAVDRFAATEPLIGDYERRVRARLRLLAAEARLGIGDSGGASLYLEQLREDDPSAAEAAQLDYLAGRRAKMDGEVAEARALWQKVAERSHRPSQARARLALIELGLETESLPAKDAVAGLERLRFAWRGDAFEFVLLRRLAELYVEAEDYRSALRALRQAVSEMPDSPYADAATARLSGIFADVFLGEPSTRIAPLTALTLYEEFKELTPAGAQGDRLIARLADRLVEVDLLDQAAELLEDQVAYRLHGEAKVRTGARLALIRLLERKPAQVLTALNASLPEEGFATMPAQLERDRRHMRSRALALLGRSAEAVALLEGDDSVEALRLNAEILWADRDWLGVAGILEKLAPPPEANLALSEADSEVLLNLAVAYSLSGRRDDLSRIGEDYGAAMVGTTWRDEFVLLTSELKEEETVSIADELSGVTRIQAFMSSYKDRLATTDSSDLN